MTFAVCQAEMNAMGSAYENNPPTGEGPMEKRPADIPVDNERRQASSGGGPMASPPPSPMPPRWSRWDPMADVPAPPPVWTRYIESRLRQFGEGH